MTKRLILAALTALVAVALATAQQISVVTEGGATTLYENLADAINGAEPGSVIYLPGGGFPLADEVKITKRLTIIGIGHKYDNDNVDGASIIAGNIFFNEGSDRSALLGCYVNGTVAIAHDGAQIDDILVRYCNVNHVEVKSGACKGLTIDQNYIRGGASFRGAPARFTHNICSWINELDGGVIENNIFTWRLNGDYIFDEYTSHYGTCCRCDNNQINNNIFLNRDRMDTGSNNVITHNMLNGADWGDDPVNISGDWNDIFVKYNNAAINPVTDFHFTNNFLSEYQEYSDCGIYGGTGFNDHQTAPVPYIVSKTVDEQTNSAGFLNITITVKAGE